MPAHRKPSNVLALKGSFDKNPSRGRERAAEPDAPSIDIRKYPVPVTLTEIEALMWRQETQRMHAGVMTEADVSMFVVYIRLLTAAHYDTFIDTKVTTQLKGYAAMFGLTPADRSRVQASKGAKSASPLDEFND
jgi:hypothetical protein